ncbi:hypothetical protein [Pedobacter paludis]|nr:hypothetical protein [Pedobacter paludis]
MGAASFLAVILSQVEGQPERYSGQRVKTPKSLLNKPFVNGTG